MDLRDPEIDVLCHYCSRSSIALDFDSQRLEHLKLADEIQMGWAVPKPKSREPDLSGIPDDESGPLQIWHPGFGAADMTVSEYLRSPAHGLGDAVLMVGRFPWPTIDVTPSDDDFYGVWPYPVTEAPFPYKNPPSPKAGQVVELICGPSDGGKFVDTSRPYIERILHRAAVRCGWVLTGVKAGPSQDLRPSIVVVLAHGVGEGDNKPELPNEDIHRLKKAAQHGAIIIYHGCHGAGCRASSPYENLLDTYCTKFPPQLEAGEDRYAAFAPGLLTIGASAVVAHLGDTTTASLTSPVFGNSYEKFIMRMMQGWPLASSMGHLVFAQAKFLQLARDRNKPGAVRLASLIGYIDTFNYVLLGSPQARVART